MSRDRPRRHRAILEIVASRQIRTQEELADALAAAGWTVTQSSVSRDIAILGLAKVDGAYHRVPARPRAGRSLDEQHIAEGVLGDDTSGETLIVLHTPAGEANRVAVSLDRLAWPEIAGTIAGDDTVFVAVRDAPGRTRTLRRLRALTRGG